MDVESYLHRLLGFVAEHAAWAPLAVFGVSFAEGLIFFGFFVPAATTLFTLGALVGAGTVGFQGVAAGGILGALAGTTLSFWIGRRYGRYASRFGPLARHPEILNRSRTLLERHGAAALIIGRFLKPARVTLPAVAGAVGMAPSRFLLFNTASVLLWVPWYLLLGMGLGRALRTVTQADATILFLSVVGLATLSLAIWLLWRHSSRVRRDQP